MLLALLIHFAPSFYRSSLAANRSAGSTQGDHAFRHGVADIDSLMVFAFDLERAHSGIVLGA